MAKVTWVNIGGTWKKVTNVWQNVGGVWKQKVIPKGNISGTWKEFMQYLLTIYDTGTEYISLVKGEGTGTVQKNTDNIYLSGSRDDVGYVNTTAVTDTMVDLTNYNYVRITVYDVQASSSISASYLVVSPNKMGTSSDYTARALIPLGSTTSTISLDVSSLSGSFYIRVHQNAPSFMYESTSMRFNKLLVE